MMMTRYNMCLKRAGIFFIIALILLCPIVSAQYVAPKNATATTIKRETGDPCTVHIYLQIAIDGGTNAQFTFVKNSLEECFGICCLIPCPDGKDDNCIVEAHVDIRKLTDIPDGPAGTPESERNKFHKIKWAAAGVISNAGIGSNGGARREGAWEWKDPATHSEFDKKKYKFIYCHEALHLAGILDRYCDRRLVSDGAGGTKTHAQLDCQNIPPPNTYVNPDTSGAPAGNKGCCKVTPLNTIGARNTVPCIGFEKDMMGAPYYKTGTPPNQTVVWNKVNCKNYKQIVKKADPNLWTCTDPSCCPGDKKPVKDKIEPTESIEFNWTKNGTMMTTVCWGFEYEVDGNKVDTCVKGKLEIIEGNKPAHFQGKKVKFRFFPPIGSTDWEQKIIYADQNKASKVRAGNVQNNKGWGFSELALLPDIGYRIPDIAPGSGGDSGATIYTAVNLELYLNSNPTAFLGGNWQVGQTLSELGISIVDGQVDGLEGIYWSVSDFEFDPLSLWGFTPTGGIGNLLNSSAYPTDLFILEEHAYESEQQNPKIKIEKTHDSYQGHFEYVSVTLEDSPFDMGGFDFLIAYDASALTFTEAQPGQLLEDCDWEYFTYRHGADGNCGDACPSGLLRIIAISETNDGPNHPSCYGPPDSDPHELANLKFYVTNDRTFECQYVPIKFFWGNCGDNSISSVDGELLYIDRAIYDFEGNLIWDEEDDDEFPEDDRIPWVGAPDYCLNPDPEKPAAERFIDFVNGGIDIICVKDIDDRGDINLNGVMNEIADATVFTNYFIYGLEAFTVNTEGQIAATDVNADGTVLSVADLTYLIRIIVGDALPYAKLTPATARYDIDDGILSVNQEMGAAHVVINGKAEPVNLTNNMEMKYNYDSEEDITRVLLYSMEKDQTFEGAILRLDGPLAEIEMATYEGATVKLISDLLPTQYVLHQNIPNPFNPITEISFSLPVASNVMLEIFNITGQKVATLAEDRFEPGTHTVYWDGTDYASGIYLYRITAGNFTDSKKMMLIK